jgi:hypothetical protein
VARPAPAQAPHTHGTLGVLAPPQRAQAGFEFVKVKGLGKVVIGACVQARDTVAHGATRGEHKHGRAVTTASQTRQQRQAVDAGNAQVQHDGVELLVLQLAQRIQPITTGFARVASRFKGTQQRE